MVSVIVSLNGHLLDDRSWPSKDLLLYETNFWSRFMKLWWYRSVIIFCLLQIKKASFADENFSVSVSKSANEVVATYTKDETGMDLVIRLPASYPLRAVDVDCPRSLGISELKQRKWLMSMLLFVRNQVFAANICWSCFFLLQFMRDEHIWHSNWVFGSYKQCCSCFNSRSFSQKTLRYNQRWNDYVD